MKIVNNFFNKLAEHIDKIYFPTVKYYRDDENNTKVHYAIERFNNGVLTYDNLIIILSKSCNESKQVIHSIVSLYIEDFEGYIFQ